MGDDFKNLLNRPRISLDALRDNVHIAQSSSIATGKRAVASQQVMVNREGQIVMGQDGSDRETQLSTVPLEVFASIAADQKIVDKYLPRNTQRLTAEGGVTGWGYEIHTELGDDFELFLFFDGAYYQVQVISPEVEDHWKSPHTGHIFGDGKICFGEKYRSGMPTLRDAFAKSVLWANGMSIALKTGQFPFSINNL